LVLNPDLAELPPPASEGWTVVLADESWLTVSAIRLAPDGICHLTTLHEVEWTTPLANLCGMTHWGHSSTPLSLVPITMQKHLPLLGETFVVAKNRNVRGLPLRSDLTMMSAGSPSGGLPSLSPLGLGLASGMTVQWKLDGTYRRLLCGLCLDKTACPEGDALVKLIINDRAPREVTLRAGDPITLETSIDLSGAQTLTIETAYGENADVCDWINLMNPVLVRE